MNKEYKMEVLIENFIRDVTKVVPMSKSEVRSRLNEILVKSKVSELLETPTVKVVKEPKWNTEKSANKIMEETLYPTPPYNSEKEPQKTEEIVEKSEDCHKESEKEERCYGCGHIGGIISKAYCDCYCHQSKGVVFIDKDEAEKVIAGGCPECGHWLQDYGSYICCFDCGYKLYVTSSVTEKSKKNQSEDIAKKPLKKSLCYCGHPKERHGRYHQDNIHTDFWLRSCAHCVCKEYSLDETKL